MLFVGTMPSVFADTGFPKTIKLSGSSFYAGDEIKITLLDSSEKSVMLPETWFMTYEHKGKEELSSNSGISYADGTYRMVVPTHVEDSSDHRIVIYDKSLAQMVETNFTLKTTEASDTADEPELEAEDEPNYSISFSKNVVEPGEDVYLYVLNGQFVEDLSDEYRFRAYKENRDLALDFSRVTTGTYEMEVPEDELGKITVKLQKTLNGTVVDFRDLEIEEPEQAPEEELEEVAPEEDPSSEPIDDSKHFVLSHEEIAPGQTITVFFFNNGRPYDLSTNNYNNYFNLALSGVNDPIRGVDAERVSSGVHRVTLPDNIRGAVQVRLFDRELRGIIHSAEFSVVDGNEVAQPAAEVVEEVEGTIAEEIEDTGAPEDEDVIVPGEGTSLEELVNQEPVLDVFKAVDLEINAEEKQAIEVLRRDFVREAVKIEEREIGFIPEEIPIVRDEGLEIERDEEGNICSDSKNNKWAKALIEAWARSNRVFVEAERREINGVEKAVVICRPHRKITRGEFATLLAANLGLSLDNKGLDRLIELGIIQGHEDGRLGEDEPLNRAQAMTILSRVYLKDLPEDLKQDMLASALESLEGLKPNHWAAIHVGALHQLGIVKGVTVEKPNGDIAYDAALSKDLTFAQAIAMFERLQVAAEVINALVEGEVDPEEQEEVNNFADRVLAKEYFKRTVKDQAEISVDRGNVAEVVGRSPRAFERYDLGRRLGEVRLGFRDEAPDFRPENGEVEDDAADQADNEETPQQPEQEPEDQFVPAVDAELDADFVFEAVNRELEVVSVNDETTLEMPVRFKNRSTGDVVLNSWLIKGQEGKPANFEMRKTDEQRLFDFNLTLTFRDTPEQVNRFGVELLVMDDLGNESTETQYFKLVRLEDQTFTLERIARNNQGQSFEELLSSLK
jgi:hypothetical protein